jgi:putative acetyltransferase
MEIRRQLPGDDEAVFVVNERAFGRPAEAELVGQLTKNGHAELSFVAVISGRVVGHILFSTISIAANGGRTVDGLALAPLAVLPEWQGKGVGSALTEHALAEIRRTGCPFVAVLGHPGYYPRFGFERASKFGIGCQWEVRDEVWMAMILDPSSMAGISGTARYLPEFEAV